MKNAYSKIEGKVAKRHKGGEDKTVGDLLADALATIEYAKSVIEKYGPGPVDEGLSDFLEAIATDIFNSAEEFRSALREQR